MSGASPKKTQKKKITARDVRLYAHNLRDGGDLPVARNWVVRLKMSARDRPANTTSRVLNTPRYCYLLLSRYCYSVLLLLLILLLRVRARHNGTHRVPPHPRNTPATRVGMCRPRFGVTRVRIEYN